MENRLRAPDEGEFDDFIDHQQNLPVPGEYCKSEVPECLKELFGELSLTSLGYIVRGMHEQINDIRVLLHALEDRIGEMREIIGPSPAPAVVEPAVVEPVVEEPIPAIEEPAPTPIIAARSLSVPPTPPPTPRSILKTPEKKVPKSNVRFAAPPPPTSPPVEERSMSEGRASSSSSRVKTLRVKWDQFMSGK